MSSDDLMYLCKPKLIESFEIFESHENFKIYKYLQDEFSIMYTNQKDFFSDIQNSNVEGKSIKSISNLNCPSNWKNIVDNIYYPEETHEPEKLGLFSEEVENTKTKYKNIWFHITEN